MPRLRGTSELASVMRKATDQVALSCRCGDAERGGIWDADVTVTKTRMRYGIWIPMTSWNQMALPSNFSRYVVWMEAYRTNNDPKVRYQLRNIQLHHLHTPAAVMEPTVAVLSWLWSCGQASAVFFSSRMAVFVFLVADFFCPGFFFVFCFWLPLIWRIGAQ